MSVAADLRALLQQGLAERVYEQASVAVYRSGELVLLEGTHDPDAVFDVASVTKVATAVLALKHTPQAELPEVMDLLAHRTGLPAWHPFFAVSVHRTNGQYPLRTFIAEPLLQERARATTRAYIRDTAPRTAPRPTYSDLNFLELGFRLEGRAELERDLKKPLDLHSLRWGGENPSAVPTGKLRPRPGNPPSDVPEILPRPSDDRAVDDDNAAAMGGLCGHAGLWANARDLAKLGDAIRQCAEGASDVPLPPDRARLLFERACGSRSYGLDTPSGENPAIGSILGKGPKGAAGHLGFTGCSLWMDRDAELSIAILSNAVIIERPNPRIRAFRPRVHDLIAKGLLSP